MDLADNRLRHHQLRRVYAVRLRRQPLPCARSGHRGGLALVLGVLLGQHGGLRRNTRWLIDRAVSGERGNEVKWTSCLRFVEADLIAVGRPLSAGSGSWGVGFEPRTSCAHASCGE